MNKEELASKISELERKIAADKVYNKPDINTDDKGHTGYALCLGGGGGKGAYQLGVYKALVDYGLWKDITAISGASIGAVNAVLFAGASPSISEEAWNKINFETVFEVAPELVFDGKPGFMTRREMLRLMDEYVDYKAVTEGKIKVYAAITRYESEEQKDVEYIDLTGLEQKDIQSVILASSALPVLYEPVEYNNRKYYDGGLVDNIPVKPLYDNGWRNIIVCGLSHDKKKDVSQYKDADIIEVYPSVSLGDLVSGTLNFSAKDTRFRSLLGYKDTMRALKVHFEHDPAYISQLDHYAAIDLADIQTQIKMDKADFDVKNTMKDIDRILSGLGIDNV